MCVCVFSVCSKALKIYCLVFEWKTYHHIKKTGKSTVEVFCTYRITLFVK